MSADVIGNLAEDPIEKRTRAGRVLEKLAPFYPEFRPMLEYETPFELLIATILSAQCTDAMVNRVTPALFAAYPSPAALGDAPLGRLEEMIHSTGFFHAKARNIKEAARVVAERFGGSVPRTMDELLTLPGVGRKTAGVVLSACYGISAIIVDTHFGRVARRLGFARSEDPGRLETEIAEIIPVEKWTEASHILNRHGRTICPARNPRCSTCPVAGLCPSADFISGKHIS